MPRRLVGPVGGVASNSAFIDKPERYAAPGTLLNVSVFGTSKRPRFGRRAAVQRLFATQLSGGAKVQEGVSIARASGTSGYARASGMSVTDFESRTLPALAGMAWVLDSNGAMRGQFKDTSSQTIGDSVIGAFPIAWSYDGTQVIFGVIATKSAAPNPAYMIINCFDLATGERVWQSILDDRATTAGTPGTLSLYPNQIVAGRTGLVYVLAGPYIYVVNGTTGVFVTRYDSGGGWGDEAMQAEEEYVGANTSKLHVLFMGSAAVSGDVTTLAHVEGWFSRSGISQWSIQDSGSGWTRDVLSTGGEGNHGTLRLSEILGRRPRGAIPFAFGRCSNGDYIVGMTNRGWNADGTLPPGGPTVATTLARFSREGVLRWERDTDSRLDAHTVGLNTYYNDIPPGIPGNNSPVGSYGVGGPEPSINAIAIDAQDNIYCGGRLNQNTATSGHNLFSFTCDGELRWRLRISGMIHQHCIKVDPTDGHIWVGGFRNQDWDGAGGSIMAHLWKVNSGTGAVLLSQDLNTASNHCYGLSVNAQGRVAYTTDTI